MIETDAVSGVQKEIFKLCYANLRKINNAILVPMKNEHEKWNRQGTVSMWSPLDWACLHYIPFRLGNMKNFIHCHVYHIYKDSKHLFFLSTLIKNAAP